MKQTKARTAAIFAAVIAALAFAGHAFAAEFGTPYDLYYVAVELSNSLEYAPLSGVEREFGPPTSVIKAEDDGGRDTLIWAADGDRPEMRITCMTADTDRVFSMSFVLSRSRDDFDAIAAGMRELDDKYGSMPFSDIDPEEGMKHEAFQLITSTSFLDETEDGVVLSAIVPGPVMEDFVYDPTLTASIPRRAPLVSIGGHIARESEGEWTKRETKIDGRTALTYTRDGSVVQYIADGDKVELYRYKSRERLASWYAGFGAGMTREQAAEWLGKPLRESEGEMVWRGIDEQFAQTDSGPTLILKFEDGAVTEVEYIEELDEKVESAELDALYIL